MESDTNGVRSIASTTTDEGGSSSIATTGGGASTGSSRNGSGGTEWRRNLLIGMENPFSVKVGQVFTGFGVGCGVGIGVGRPIYLGAIPALQQVLTATRGATDVLSGAGRHVNSSLRKLGVKGLEAGVGCGVGIGHGFGVGLAIKPSAIQRIQSCLGEMLVKIMTNLGVGSGSSLQSIIPGSLQTHAPNGTLNKSMQTSIRNSLQIATRSTGSVLAGPRSNGSSQPSETPVISHSEKVISSFLQNPVLNNEKEMTLNELAENLRLENNMLQVLLNHQQIIEKLIGENEKLRQILVEDLKVSPSKLQTTNKSWIQSGSPCTDCFECRRRKRSTR